jgi:hypothetical protein
MKDGAVLDEDARLLQPLAGGERRGQGRVVGGLAGDDLEQGHDGDRVEEVEADHALRVGQVRRPSA